jgi:hypothetical protein
MNFEALIKELKRKPLCKKSGKTAVFGAVISRDKTVGYSRWCWTKPKLYKLLLEFAQQYITTEYSTIILSYNSKKSNQKVKSRGVSTIIGFGDYTGGNLSIDGIDVDIRSGYTADVSKSSIMLQDYTGDRFQLTFYTLPTGIPQLLTPSVVQIGNKYYFKNGDIIIKNGEPLYNTHKNTIIKVIQDIIVYFP